MNRLRRTFGIAALSALILMIYLYNTTSYDCCWSFFFDRPSVRNASNQRAAAEKLSNNQIDKWIVVTTINYPTDAVRVLANQTGWRIVIVADKKTPSDWNFPGCDFLSVERQKKLNFAVSSLIPYNSYTRKMIGYLYAIQNGAQWIYDTDDDNQPVGVGIQLFDTQPYLTGLSYGKESQKDCNITKPLFNAYAFWGQPKIWPRGYPLEEVRKENDETQFSLCKKQKVPAIQQGLVLKDPDVDAVFRLLHADEANGLDVNFNKHAPPIILNAGTFCPFNSQNTMFHYDAFWSLFLPVSVAFRVTDIWRGYFAQKLLHLTGNRLAFYPVNAVQKRNPHSYLADFEDEIQLYVEAGKMVKFISKWTCEYDSFQDCMKKLSRDFLKEKFWKKLDVALVDAWIADLENMGYIFPTLLKFSNEKRNSTKFNPFSDCRNTALYNPANRNKPAEIRSTYNHLKEWCNEVLPENETITSSFRETAFIENEILKKLSRLALIITGNHPFGPSISVLQRLYGNFFATIIFCGPIYTGNISKSDGYLPLLDYNYINVTEEEIDLGYRAYICTAKAIELRLQNIDGYVVIADDTQFNFWNDFNYSRFRLWGSIRETNGFWWNNEMVGRNAMKRAIELIKNRIKEDPNSALANVFAEYAEAVGGDGFTILQEEDVWSVADFYYVPKENETVFYEMSEVFFEAHLFHEIAVPKIGAGLQWFEYYNSTELDIKEHIQLWSIAREVWEKAYWTNFTYLHPIKLSFMKDFQPRRRYCKSVIKSYFSSLVKMNMESNKPDDN